MRTTGRAPLLSSILRASIRGASILGVLALAASPPAIAQWACDDGPQPFSQGIPPGWSVVDEGDVVWSDLASCGEGSNYTGGDGGAACASSDRAGLGGFATELRSPLFDLTTATAPALAFKASYQNFAGADVLEVAISLDQGASWDPLLDWREDHGAFRDTPGEDVEFDLSAYRGLSGLTLRWRYADPDAGASAWYAQVDEAAVVCDRGTCDTPPVVDGLVNGGFEGAGAWTATSTRFATPLCTSATCGFAGARSGDAWAFLGGSGGEEETASVSQSVRLDAGLAVLDFHLWVPAASGGGGDRLVVTLDGETVFSAGEAEAIYRGGYRRVAIDLSPWADGGQHLLAFTAVTSGEPSHTSFLLDDVSLAVCTSVVADPDILLSGPRLAEGSHGTRDAVFTVTLSDPSPFPIDVEYTTSDITATAGSDYTATAGTLRLAQGTRSRSFAVPVRGDTVDEPDETFQVTLTGSSRGVLFRPDATAVIENDDFAYASIGDAAVLEVDDTTTQAVFTVQLSSPSSQTIAVSYATADLTAEAGDDYMATAGTLSFPPGATSRTVTVDVVDDRRVERDERFLVTLENASAAQIDRDQGVGTIVDNDRGRYPVPGTDVVYTDDVDFDQGRLLNVHHDVPGQLQLARAKSTYPYIWVAASARGTVVKVDTRTGTILGEYSTSPDTTGGPNPSRTTVALDGSVWAGNRNDGSVIHVGLIEEQQCVDRNGNGTIDTSRGYGDVLAWADPGGVDSAGGVASALDECILHYVKVKATRTRHLSIDAGNDVWVSGIGGANDRVFELLDGDTGSVLRTEGPFPCGGYGGLVDRDGVLWSATYNGPVLRFDTVSGAARCVGGVAAYGLAIDGDGALWVAGPSGDRVWRVSADGDRVDGPFRHGSAAAQGLAADAAGHVWVSSAKWGGSATVGHLLPDGTFLGNVTGVPPGSSGVAVDVTGKVWTANAAASSLSRIDPALGPVGSDGRTRIGGVDLTVPLPGASPYNYSDMTGALALANTSPQGTWQVIQDSGVDGAGWGVVSWNLEDAGAVPAGTGLVVEARAAETEAALGAARFVVVENGLAFDLTGRYLQVRATLKASASDATPVLSDLRIALREPAPPGLPTLRVTNADVFEPDSGSVPATFTVTLSAPSDGSVAVAYRTVEASASAGTDYTPVTASLGFPAGSTTQTVTVAVLGDNDEEEDEAFFLTLETPQGAVIADGLGTATIFDDDFRLGPVAGDDRTYTRDEDFDLGRLFNTHHDAPLGDQLQVTEKIGPFPFLWIAASGRGTIVKIDTRTGAVLGEYSTNPDNRGGPNPSRTTVTLDGSVWAGNRGDASVIHVGLVEEGQCVDRNGNGVIETSNGYGNILAWPNPGGVDTNGGVSTALDECILHYVKTQPSIPRHVSVDAAGNIWVSGWEGRSQSVFQLIDGRTGGILRATASLGCGGYGGLVDADGVVWSVSLNGSVLRWDPSVDPPTATSKRCIGGLRAYGMGIDSEGDIVVSRPFEQNDLYRIDRETLQVTRIDNHGSTCAQGLAIDENDQIWVSSARFCATSTVGHVDGKTDAFVGNVTGVPRGTTGVAIDGEGYVWVAADNDSKAARIDPDAGPLGADGVTRVGAVDLVVNLPGASPYNYSDMTGILVLRTTAPRGTWTVIQDGGETGTRWGRVTWNTEAEGPVPAGASIAVEARVADTVAGLGGRPFTTVSSGVEFLLEGRYIEVRVVLRPNLGGESPVLSDLRIATADLGLPAIVVDDVTVTEGDAGSVDAVFTVSLSAPSAAEVLVDYDTTDGSATAGDDYLATAGRLVFPPGTTAVTVAVPVLADALDEPDESFFLDLSLPVGGTLADAQGLGTIHDDDPSVSLDVAGVTVTEGDPEPEGVGTVEAIFTFTLSAPTARVVRVDYATEDDSATGGVDYRVTSGYVEIPAGETTAEVAVTVHGDLEPEDDERFWLLVSNVDGAVELVEEAAGVVLDDDLRELTIDDVAVDEGDDGTVDAVFTIALSRPTTSPVTVAWATSPDAAAADAATAGTDYLSVSGAATLAAGEDRAQVAVPVVGDLFVEGDETFLVVLEETPDAVLLDGIGLGTIRDDETCFGTELLANPGAEERAAGGEPPHWTPLLDTRWQRREAPPQPVDGEASFAPGSDDYAELWQDVDVRAYAAQIATGKQQFRFSGFLRTFDELPSDVAQIVVEYRNEADGTVLDVFDTGQTASVLAWAAVEDVRAAPVGTGWIRVRLVATRFTEGTNDAYFDALSLRSLGVSTVTVDDVELYEGDTGSREAIFTVQLSCPLEAPLAVRFQAADGSAVAVEDYLATAGTLVFEPGTVSLEVAVPVVGDEIHERHESFHLDLTLDDPRALVALVDPRGDGRIVNDDFCARSPGFWKNHVEDWPLAELEVGDVRYDAAGMLALLEYNGPDAASHLARQLVATELNLAVGADPEIVPTVEEAHLALVLHPPGSRPRGADRVLVETLKDVLDAYNSSDCAQVPVDPELAARLGSEAGSMALATLSTRSGGAR